MNRLFHMDWRELSSRFSLEKLGDLFVYHQEAPMLFSSGLFLFLFIGFLIIYLLLKKKNLARIIYVVLFSLFFYYKSSGIWFILLLFTSTSDFLIGKQIHQSTHSNDRKWWLILSLSINLGMLGYFKYFHLLMNLVAITGRGIGALLGNAELQSLTYEPMDIFLPVGISFFTFQSLSYIIDIYRGQVTPLRRWIDYLFYVSFFPQLVAGPIVRAKDFIPQIWKSPGISRSEFGRGFFLVLCGLFKKIIISDYISLNFVDRVFADPLLYTGVENLLGIYGYALQIYCDFSGYSDMAIGIALLLGFRFRINFDSPYQSASITEFWRRWHISLSSWLKDYLYISLGGNRKGKIRTYLNLFITMLLGGLWHGALLRFLFWGALHGIGLIIHKLLMSRLAIFKLTGRQMPLWLRIPGILLTFHFVCFGWIFFRVESMQLAGEMLNQIFTRFHPEIFIQFVEGYSMVFTLMILGFILHFMPKRLEISAQQAVAHSPILVQALLLVLMIFLIFQFKSANVQPFIYFQF